MNTDKRNPYSAGEQSLGYMYQARFALLTILQLPEDHAVLIEKDDDLDLSEVNGQKSLASLKHKAIGDRLTDLSLDFWKSVNIWLSRYQRDGAIQSKLRFLLFTTAAISENSFLTYFRSSTTPRGNTIEEQEAALALLESSLKSTTAPAIRAIHIQFDLLDHNQKIDFIDRITIFDDSPRISALPQLIVDQHMRTVRREFRKPVFERLEGWWNDLIIDLLTGNRTKEVYGHEVSDKLASFADEYKIDNLPINFRDAKPTERINPTEDTRLFVFQLRTIGVGADRIQTAILDFYRAFEQRSSWARENVLIAGEVEAYEDRLVEEWTRYKDVVFDELDPNSADIALQKAGRELYKWAEFNTDHLRIRDRVSEPYVVRGNFHILANNRPKPRIYWHPTFLTQIKSILSDTVA